MDYLKLLEPIQNNQADVVYGSRYLLQTTRRILYFWHTMMNRFLTFTSNMFTNLDLTDMETCYKLFRRETLQKLAPHLKEKRFGFESEITALIAQAKCRVWECAIHYNPRSYEEGKKINYKDGFHALYCILHYSAHSATLPMQLLLYFFIGGLSAVDYGMTLGVPPTDCKIIYATSSITHQYNNRNLDMFEIANRFHLKTINGYSGRKPFAYQYFHLDKDTEYLNGIQRYIDYYHLQNVCAYDFDTRQWEYHSK